MNDDIVDNFKVGSLYNCIFFLEDDIMIEESYLILYRFLF